MTSPSAPRLVPGRTSDGTRRTAEQTILAFERHKIALRYFLIGAGWHTAGEALTYAEGIHTGTRKDGITPELAHQVAIASHLRTLAPHLGHQAEATLAVGLLHDVREDYGVADEEIRRRFGNDIADSVDSMTKEFRGVKRDEAELFARMGQDPRASVAKGVDRLNNLDTMHGVFSLTKMAEYVAETRELHLPMLKTARRNFPIQEGAYENIKLMMTTQVRLFDAIIAAESDQVDQAVA